MKKTTTLFLATILTGTLAGCGDDDAPPPPPPTDAGDGDGGTVMDAGTDDAGADAATVDSGGDEDAGTPPPCVLDRLFAVTAAADFSASRLGLLDIAAGTGTENGMDLSDTDTVPDLVGCNPALLERATGSLRVQDADDPFTTLRTIDLNPTGVTDPYASNPMRVISVSDTKAYVLLGGRSAIAVVDPTMEGTAAVTGEIDLSSRVKAGDMDGNVDVLDGILIGDELWVALGHYWFDTSFVQQFEGSELVIIDTATDTVTGNVELNADNPWRGLFHDEANATLLVGSMGLSCFVVDASCALDGVIETVDLATDTVTGSIIAETDVSTVIRGYYPVSDTRMILLTDAQVVSVDPTLDFIVPEVIDDASTGMLVHDGVIYSWDRNDTGALEMYDVTDGSDLTPTGGPVAFGAHPVNAVSPSP